MSQNILITGGAGFIGKNLIKKLFIQENIKYIIILDNFITSNKSKFIKFLSQYYNKCFYFECDITNIIHINDVLLTLQSKFHITEIHQIYHLASLASPKYYKQFPIETLDVGYLGTRNILEIAKVFNSTVLFTSTSEVYGDAQIHPQHENYYGNVNPFGERSCYDESKRIAESLCYSYQKLYNLDIKIARIFNTYGPYMQIDDGRIIPEIIKSLFESTQLTIYGDGTQTRSYCFVGDTVDQLIKLINSDCNDPVNIGTQFELTINDTVKQIQDIWNIKFNTNSIIDILYKPLTQNDPFQRKPCLHKNFDTFGHLELTPFNIGILHTIDYFNNNIYNLE